MSVGFSKRWGSFSRGLGFVLGVILAVGGEVSAITLDRLTEGQFIPVSCSGGLSQTVSEVKNGSPSTILGGTRSLQVECTPSDAISVGTVSAVVGSGFLKQSQGDSSLGHTVVVYDGDLTPGVTDPAGLGSIDFTADSADSFKFLLSKVDLGNGLPVTLQVTVYSNGDGDQWSTGRVIIATDHNGPDALEALIPFADFGTDVGDAGANGPADFTSISAVRIDIIGDNPAHDLSLSYIGTNGRCEHIPVGGFIVDRCDVCNGTNECVDCEDQPFGNALPGESCTTGLLGMCSVGMYSDSCKCTQTHPESPETCDGQDNDCDGEIDEIYDACGVCGGDNSSCLDCAGIPNGKTVMDQCGVCGGDGSSCLDCEGTAFGTMAFDVCGVCGGDGTSCLDCAGIPNGRTHIDECGVCDGDGTSCGCNEYDQSFRLATLDNGAKRQEDAVTAALAQLQRLDKSKKIRKYVRKTAEVVHDLQLRNWFLSWQLPVIVTECEGIAACASVSNTTTIEEYSTNANAIQSVLDEVLGKLGKKRYRVRKRLIARLARRGASRLSENLDVLATVPVEQSVCSGSES